jgi:hypothetical protein
MTGGGIGAVAHEDLVVHHRGHRAADDRSMVGDGMNTQSAGKWVLVLLAMLLSAVAHAESYYLDSNYDDTRPHYRTMQEACVTGELESRIDGYRASETNPNVRYRMVSENIGPDDGLGEFPCQAVI